jgi:serine/threonine protein phosphatase 1
MLSSFKKLLRARPQRALPAVPPGERVYAIGDIHGRLDLFEALIEAVEADDAARSAAATTVILLGDLVDRGPDSAGVIAAARDWASRRRVRMITGNHEEMFLAAFNNVDVLRQFLRFGGRETVFSYPIDRNAYEKADFAQTQSLMARAVPEKDLEFLRGFEDMILVGDYLFVHAGIDPEVPISEQKIGALRWIREPFLNYPGDHGQVVVHGHTITEEPVFRPNRIGIDTGAFSSGRLTALGLEGTESWLIETRYTDGVITAEARSIA